MAFKIITDYPKYRIHDTGVIETCMPARGKGNKDSDTPDWRILKQTYDKSCGYYIVCLYNEFGRKNKRVHRLLMEAFVPNPLNKKQINHKDANKLNNDMSNLEWATSSENTQHAFNIGLMDAAVTKASTPVLQYVPNTLVVLAEYSSLHEAERVTNVAWQNIWKVCNNKRHTAGGYHWQYKNV